MYEDEWVPLETFKRVFGMPRFLFENIEAWTHEFTEDSIVDALRNIDAPLFDAHKYFNLSGGVSTTIHHILASLSCISLLGNSLATPNSFWRFLKNRCLHRKVRK